MNIGIFWGKLKLEVSGWQLAGGRLEEMMNDELKRVKGKKAGFGI